MQRISITNPQNVIDGTAKKYYFRLRNTGGPKGDKGDKGDTGTTGPQGPQGNAATVSVGSTTTLPVGYDATVTNIGSIYNAVLDFGIPQGPQGPQGAKGDKGDTGAKGDTGPRGPQGEKGTNATVYIGTTSTLAPGSQATVYNSGSDSNAVLNFGIPQGAKGDTGSQGPQGPAGQNFAPTVVAALPATGDESKLYLTPKAHTSQTATGNPITASISDGAGSMESFQLDGDTYQQTYTGKNLFNFVSRGTAQGLTATYDTTTGAITVTGKATANYSNISAAVNLSLEAGQTFTSSIDIELPVRAVTRVIYTDDTEESFDIEPSGTSVTWSPSKQVKQARLYISLTTAGTSYDLSFKFQIEAGSTATSFEPYVGGQASPSPNPDYPQAIQTVTGEQTVTVVGKNLFDKANVVNGIPSQADGSIVSTSSVGRTSDYIPVVSSTVYSHTGHPAGWAVIAWYKADKSFIERTDNATTTTSPNEAAYARVSCAESNLGTCQFEIGQPTDYAPYHATSYPISLGTIELCKLGDYQDYIWKDGDDWKVHKATKKVELDEQSGWTKNQYGTNAYGIKTEDVFTAVAEIGVISPQFIAKSYNGRTDAVDNIIFADSNDGMSITSRGISIRNTAWSDLSSFITWVTSNPVTAYYVLATPTDTTITDQTLIAQLEAIRTAALQNGANTISNTAAGSNLAGDMEISYYGYNPTNRYDKFIWLDLNNNYEQIGE